MKAEAAIKIYDNIRKIIPHRFLTLQAIDGEDGKWQVIGWDREGRWSVAIPLDQPNDDLPIKVIAQKINQIIAEKEKRHEILAKARMARGQADAGSKSS